MRKRPAMLKLDHLSMSNHEEAARLVKQVQDDLDALTRIVERAPFTDTVLRVQKRVQESVVDPLNEAFQRRDDVEPRHHGKSLYPSVGYSVQR
jgi:hypothetical protein